MGETKAKKKKAQRSETKQLSTKAEDDTQQLIAADKSKTSAVLDQDDMEQFTASKDDASEKSQMKAHTLKIVPGYIEKEFSDGDEDAPYTMSQTETSHKSSSLSNKSKKGTSKEESVNQIISPELEREKKVITNDQKDAAQEKIKQVKEKANDKLDKEQEKSNKENANKKGVTEESDLKIEEVALTKVDVEANDKGTVKETGEAQETKGEITEGISKRKADDSYGMKVEEGLKSTGENAKDEPQMDTMTFAGEDAKKIIAQESDEFAVDESKKKAEMETKQKEERSMASEEHEAKNRKEKMDSEEAIQKADAKAQVEEKSKTKIEVEDKKKSDQEANNKGEEPMRKAD